MEGKLFGIGSESYVVGSHEFYLGYAITRRKLLCLDTGHYHPTESPADKISAVMQWLDRMLLHVRSRRAVGQRSCGHAERRIVFNCAGISARRFFRACAYRAGLFDASINRVAAWVIGSRAVLKALLAALLEPTAKLREMEAMGDYTGRLAMLEESKSLPMGAVWDYYCERQNVPSEGRVVGWNPAV